MRIRTRNNNGGRQVWDAARKVWVVLTPEEHVRQLLLSYMVNEMGYPLPLIAVERGLSFGHTTLRFDIAVYHRDTAEPWLLAECKAPNVELTDVTLRQLLQYHSKLPTVRYWLLTNGQQTFCADAHNPLAVMWLNTLPAY